MHMLRGTAKDWWGLLEAELAEDEVHGMTWEEFLVRFRARFVPQVEVDRITREFLALTEDRVGDRDHQTLYRDGAVCATVRSIRVSEEQPVPRYAAYQYT